MEKALNGLFIIMQGKVSPKYLRLSNLDWKSLNKILPLYLHQQKDTNSSNAWEKRKFEGKKENIFRKSNVTKTSSENAKLHPQITHENRDFK